MHCQYNDCHSNELHINFDALADAAIVLKCMAFICGEAEIWTECCSTLEKDLVIRVILALNNVVISCSYHK